MATSDAKGVPMVRPSDSATSPRVSHRRGKGEKAHKKQMAYAGATYSINRFPRTADEIVNELLRRQRAKDRPRPQHKRVWAEMTHPGDGPREGTLLHGPSYLFVGLAVECHARDPDHKKELICLLDGERQLWDLQQEWLPRAVGILDIFHVTEWLWTAAHCFYPEGSAATDLFVERYLRMLLEGKVDTVIRSLRQLLSTRRLKGEKRKRLMATLTYYQNNRQHMRYDSIIRATAEARYLGAGST